MHSRSVENNNLENCRCDSFADEIFGCGYCCMDGKAAEVHFSFATGQIQREKADMA
jgi:hypothetical protein